MSTLPAFGPLIGNGPQSPPAQVRKAASRVRRLAGVGMLAVVTFAVFSPTLQDRLLPVGFDDGLIFETPAIRALNMHNLWSITTDFTQAHYMPLTFLSLAVDYHFWRFDPFGYHLTNILLHTLAAVLVWAFLQSLLRSYRHALLGALIFALHPVQLEVVAVAIQRKTILASCLFFITLLLYQRWRARGRRGLYIASVVVFTAAVLAKQSVVTLPLVLILYDYCFVDGRLHLPDKIPYFLAAAAASAAAIWAHTEIGAIHSLHGGTLTTHILLMSRVFVEYAACLVAPLDLAPTYYYQQAILFTPSSFLYLATVLFVPIYVIVRRRRDPWSFFCLGWFILVILPEAQILPLAQPRADRFLYLAMLGFAMRIAVTVRDVALTPHPRRVRLAVFALALLYVSALAGITYRSTGMWRNQVTAWQRVVQRHPWAASAHYLLGVAYLGMHNEGQAREEWQDALRLNPDLPEPYLSLARWYAERGRVAEARVRLSRFLELKPDDLEGLQLQRWLRSVSPGP